MANAAIPVLSMNMHPQAFADAIGESFRNFGFAMVRDFDIEPDLIARAWQITKAFFALSDEEKRRFHRPLLAGARGFTPYRTEIAKGAEIQDLKEFWHVGRDLPAGHPLSNVMPPNLWPEHPAGFRETFTALFAAFDRAGAILLSRIALHLELPENWFEPAISESNSILRLVHYPPLRVDPRGALRAGPHEDINLITLLLGAEETGLELLGRDGTWLAVDPPPGAMVVNIGDMLQRLTNHVLPSTTHRVSNPVGEGAMRSRFAMPYFLHLRSNHRIETIPSCISAENPDRYPQPVSAHDYLEQRLREIGLLT